MRRIGARHPNVPFAPDNFARWSRSDEKPAMTTALESLAKLPNSYLRVSSTSLGPYPYLSDLEEDLFVV